MAIGHNYVGAGDVHLAPARAARRDDAVLHATPPQEVQEDFPAGLAANLVFKTISAHADGERRGLDRLGKRHQKVLGETSVHLRGHHLG